MQVTNTNDTQKSTLSNRTVWVDYAKALGIILVVYGHVSRGLFKAHIPMNETLFKMIDTVIYHFHMPLFFFLSGLFFIRSLQKRGLKGLIANKLDSIFYLYLIWSVLQDGISQIFQQWTNDTLKPVEISSLFLAPSGQFWFLYALFFITVISAFLFAKIHQRYALAFFLLSSVIVIVNTPNYNITPLVYVLPNLCFFMFGIYFNQLENFFSDNKYSLLLPVALLFIGAHWLSLTQQHFVPDYFLSAVKLAITLISILFSITLCMCLADKHITLFSTIGASSMVIFLLHVITGSGTRIMLQHFLGFNNYWIHIILGCLFGLFGSMLLAQLLSKIGLSFLFEIPQQFSVEKKLNKLAVKPSLVNK